MPLWRKLWTKTTESLDVNDMPDDFTRLLWVLLPLALDREGRSLNSAPLIRSRLFPLRDDVTNSMVQDTIDWFCAHEMLQRYQVNGRLYFWCPSWSTHQGDTSREAGSNHPGPDEGEVMTYSRPTHDLLTTDSRTEENRREESIEEKRREDLPEKASGDNHDGASENVSPVPKESTEHQKLFGAVAEVCSIDLKVAPGEGPRSRGAIAQCIGVLEKQDVTPADLQRFSDWWYASDWRGLKGQPPAPNDIRSEWGAFKAGRRAKPNRPMTRQERSLEVAKRRIEKEHAKEAAGGN